MDTEAHIARGECAAVAVAARRSAVTNALNQVTHTAYDPQGRVLATWGATYPVAYEYDHHGRMTAMATTRDPAHESINLWTLVPAGTTLTAYSLQSTALDLTQWDYDPATGLLLQKLYADNKGPSYDYYADGRLKTRTWAREVPDGQGGTEPLVATYSYDALGQLAGVEYSDATPDLAYTYDRMGRQISVTDVMGTRTFAYDPDTLQLESETIPLFDPNETVTLTHVADGLGRPAGMYLGDAQAPDYRVEYGYEVSGRMGTVSYGDHVFTNHYLPGANLHAGVTVTDPVNGRAYAFLRSYEPHRDLIASVSNTVDSVVISRYAYINDALGRRTDREDGGREFSSAIPNAFGYNIRSELIAADMGADRYDYVYDPIGNRTSYTNNSAVVEYTANPLNQYAAITGRTNPLHDDDGNMLDDGASLRMVWNGENRMTSVTNGQVVVVSAYDHMGRRVKKEVYDGSTKTAERVYVYDRWNVIRELDMTGGTPAVERSYIWGLDLSGGLQGAGGVGGLLAVDDGASVCYATYDANSNVSEYLNSATAATAAHYEYDGFGNLTAATGAATAFPHRFSTKYTDDESGLVYYGYRYYSPEMGRWVNRDPIGEQGGFNIYTAFINNSIIYIEILGARPELCGVILRNIDDKVVRTSADIRVEKNMELAYTGIFRPPEMSTRSGDGLIKYIAETRTVMFVLRIEVKPYEPSKDDRITYSPHVLDGTDGAGCPLCPTDATIEHERGHADAWIEVLWTDEFKRNIQEAVAEIRGRIDERSVVFRARAAYHLYYHDKKDTYNRLTAQYANDRTYQWFKDNQAHPISTRSRLRTY